MAVYGQPDEWHEDPPTDVGPLPPLPARIAVIGGKGDDERQVFVVMDFPGYESSSVGLRPRDAIRLGLGLIRQAVAEKIGVAW